MSLPLSRTSRYSVFDRPTLESHEDPGIFRDGKPHEKAIPGSTTGAICPQAKTEKDMWDQQQRYPSTERLYMLDTYQMSAEARLLGLLVEDEGQPLSAPAAILDKTIFHPQGGGQPSDTGVITCGSWSMQVDMVRDRSGVIHHFGKQSGAPPPAGESALLTLDSAKRNLHALLHSAGHGIDSAVATVLGRGVLEPLKGYHFADSPYVEYKGKLPDDLEKDAFIEKLNRELDRLVTADVETKVELADEANDEGGQTSNGSGSSSGGASMLGVGGAVGHVTQYGAASRIVTVGGVACPCGGTHVKSTGQLKGTVVTKIKSKKGTLRVSYTLSGLGGDRGGGGGGGGGGG